MSAAGTPSTDPWVILARERARYEEQFRGLSPINGIVTGNQAKGFLLRSELPPAVLGQIWSLADTDSDGKMDIHEFSIACKLINLKLRGMDVPASLPPSLLASLRVQSVPVAPVASAPPPTIPPLPMVPAVAQQPPALVMMQQYAATQPPPPIPPLPAMMQPQMPLIEPFVPVMPTAIAPPMTMSPIAAAPIASNTQRTSVTSLDRAPMALESPQAEWAVPHHVKLKYTQIFNTTDRTRSGYLSGPQARNVMVQTKLPQNILAQVWSLSDMDNDGRLGCEEFVLAMHLCEQASMGVAPPVVLAADLVPPSFRRPGGRPIPVGAVASTAASVGGAPTSRSGSRATSISSQGSAPGVQQQAVQPADVGDLTLMQQNSFEDKRKENFDKGQAELERRRKALLDAQRKEAEERERKEREEADRRERARLEAERRRTDELERQLREQQERDRQLEEERRREVEQRETARREMERQRQLEWEKQRLQDLQQQRQREQEAVLKLKAKNQSLTIELSSLNDQVRELSQKICDTRVGVSNVKSTIDGMRSTRDTQMQDMSQLKNKLKEQNAKLLQMSQEKARMDARNKSNPGQSASEQQQQKLAFENKEITIKNLREKIDDMESQIDGKMSDIENNNSQLTDLKTQMTDLIKECENLFGAYEERKSKVIEMKSASRAMDYGSAWKDDWGSTNAAPPAAEEWPVDNWAASGATTAATNSTDLPGMIKYRALYEFVQRNKDEISFQAGDIINVSKDQTGDPGWLAGEIRGSTGWFPESYVEPVDGVGVIRDSAAAVPPPEVEPTKLEGIAEVPETIPEPAHIITPTAAPPPTAAAATPPDDSATIYDTVAPPPSDAIEEYYIASYPYQSVEQGDLNFSAGDLVVVIKKDGDWWTGRLDDNRVGIFPSNYVQKTDINAKSNVASDVAPVAAYAAPAAPASNNNNSVAAMPPPPIAALTDDTDNEIAEINESKPDYSSISSQVASNQATPKPGTKKPEIASVIAPYEATSKEQLSLARGQLIMIRKKTDSGWWEGELQAKGRKRQVGWFPASYVKVMNSSGRISGRSTPVSTTRIQQEVVIDKVMALYPYTAANPDELSFLKDDIISVTGRDEQAWWRGELNGMSGLFPSNYVSPLQ